MPLPLIVAAAVCIGGMELFKRYQKKPHAIKDGVIDGEDFSLPQCCLVTLKQPIHNNETLVVALGAAIHTNHVVSQIGVEKFGSLEKSAKFVHDVSGTVTIDWGEEAELQTNFARGIRFLATDGAGRSKGSAYDVASRHYRQHINDKEPSDAKRFWKAIMDKKLKTMSTKTQQLENVFNEMP